MEGDMSSHSLTYSELEEKSRIRRAQYDREDAKFEAECARDIEVLQASYDRKLETFDEESHSSKDDFQKAAQGAITNLKARHEAELRIVKTRHAEEMAELEKDGKKNVMCAVKIARDQRSDLERAFGEALTKKKQEHVKVREQTKLERNLEKEAEMAQLYIVFQRTVAGEPNEVSRPMVAAKEHPSPSIRPSSSYSPEYFPRLNNDSDDDDDDDDGVVDELPTRAGKRRMSLTYNDDVDTSSILMLREDELHTDPLTQGPKSSASWEFATRYTKTKDKLPAAAPTVDLVPLQHTSSLPARPIWTGFSRQMPEIDTQSRHNLPTGSRQVVYQGHATGYGQNSATLPSRNQANMSSPFSKAPANAPRGPRGTLHVSPQEQPKSLLPVVATPQQADRFHHDSKRARLEVQGASMSKHVPPQGGESSNVSQQAASSRRHSRGNVRGTFQDDVGRERRESRQNSGVSPSESISQISGSHFDRLPAFDPNRGNRALIHTSKPHPEADSNSEPRGRSSFNSEGSEQGGNLPVIPALPTSSALKRTFIDSYSKSLPQRPASILVDAYAIKKIQYARNDETLFEWTQSVPGKTELRLDNFIYKPYIKNQVWQVCQDWHYSNWAINPDHVEMLRYNQELGILHVKRVKTFQAGTELWVGFEDSKSLMRFLENFKRRPGCAKKDIQQLHDKAGIPEFLVKC